MRALPVTLVALSACSSSIPSGDADADFATLMASTDVDCTTEPQCGPVPHCLRDALDDGRIGVLQRTATILVSNSGGRTEQYPQYLFTYEGSVIVIDDMRNTTESPGVYEQRCTQLITVATGTDCWSWKELQCELP